VYVGTSHFSQLLKGRPLEAGCGHLVREVKKPQQPTPKLDSSELQEGLKDAKYGCRVWLQKL